MQVASLYRYPVKGLSPERVDRLRLTRGEYVPGDRLFAIENGPSGFDTQAPQHQPKIKFLMLMRDERLAQLSTRFDADTSTLVIVHEGREAVRADVSTPEGRRSVESLMASFMSGELRGPPKMLAAPAGFRFTDSRRGFVSLINLASVRAIEEMVGRRVDPLRFRGNVMIEGLAPWAEFDLIDRVIGGPSGLRLRGSKRILRCAATNVDPQSAERDLDIPGALMRHLGHADCGIYAEVIGGGSVAAGDMLSVEPERQASLPFAEPQL